jgi:hypothetical protein
MSTWKFGVIDSIGEEGAIYTGVGFNFTTNPTVDKPSALGVRQEVGK